jgi:hypothetical protein
MKLYRTLLILALCGAAFAGQAPQTDEQHAALYRGESLNYVITPPDQFSMVDWEATADGYSFAFIPSGQAYDSAEVTIGVNIYKIRGLVFRDVIARDTVALRKHYGKNVSIWSVDSVHTASGQSAHTFFINDTTRFIPNVMISYLDGRTEMLVFELVISERAARVKAEDAFMQCLNRMKALPIGQLGQK